MTGNITLEPIKGWQTNLMLATHRSQSKSDKYYTSNHSVQGINGKGSYSGSASLTYDNDVSNYLELTSKFNKTL